MNRESHGEIVLYQREDGTPGIEVPATHKDFLSVRSEGARSARYRGQTAVNRVDAVHSTGAAIRKYRIARRRQAVVSDFDRFLELSDVPDGAEQ